MKARNWESIIAKHLDGVATIEEVADLSTAIESDESVRLLYLRMARVHAGLATSSIGVGRVVSLAEERPFWRSGWMKVAALFVVGFAVFTTFWFGGNSQAVITDVTGAVRWTRIDGNARYIDSPGASVSAGTLESMTPDSSATLTFADGSTVTVSGQSNLMVSNEGEKLLSLRGGMFFANVEPQSIGKPLRLHTSVAEMTVLGTRFDVIADEFQTQLIVNQGRVGLQRIVDDSSVEVRAGYRTVAMLEMPSPLQVVAIPNPTRSWKSDLERDVDMGRWAPADISVRLELTREVEAGRISAEDMKKIYVARLSNLPEGAGAVYAAPVRNRNEVLYFASLSAKLKTTQPVMLTEGARFRVQGKVSSPADIVIGVAASDVERSHPGRFLARERAVAGAFDLEIPVNELRAKDRGAAGLELFSWFCFTSERVAQLTISSVELSED